MEQVWPTSLPISSDREAIVCLHWLVGLRPYRRPTLLSRALPTGAPIARTQQPTTPMHEHGIESGNTSTVSAPSRKVSTDWPQHGTPRRCSCFAVAGGNSWLRVARDAALQAQQTGRPTTAPRLPNVVLGRTAFDHRMQLPGPSNPTHTEPVANGLNSKPRITMQLVIVTSQLRDRRTCPSGRRMCCQLPRWWMRGPTGALHAAWPRVDVSANTSRSPPNRRANYAPPALPCPSSQPTPHNSPDTGPPARRACMR